MRLCRSTFSSVRRSAVTVKERLHRACRAMNPSCVAVWFVDMALDGVQPDCSVGQLHLLLSLQLPADVRRVVARPGVPCYCERAGIDGAVLADGRHHRVVGCRPGLCHQLCSHRHQADHHRPHPACSAAFWTLPTTTSQVLCSCS